MTAFPWPPRGYHIIPELAGGIILWRAVYLRGAWCSSAAHIEHVEAVRDAEAHFNATHRGQS